MSFFKQGARGFQNFDLRMNMDSRTVLQQFSTLHSPRASAPKTNGFPPACFFAPRTTQAELALILLSQAASCRSQDQKKRESSYS